MNLVEVVAIKSKRESLLKWNFFFGSSKLNCKLHCTTLSFSSCSVNLCSPTLHAERNLHLASSRALLFSSYIDEPLNITGLSIRAWFCLLAMMRFPLLSQSGGVIDEEYFGVDLLDFQGSYLPLSRLKLIKEWKMFAIGGNLKTPFLWHVVTVARYKSNGRVVSMKNVFRVKWWLGCIVILVWMKVLQLMINCL